MTVLEFAVVIKRFKSGRLSSEAVGSFYTSSADTVSLVFPWRTAALLVVIVPLLALAIFGATSRARPWLGLADLGPPTEARRPRSDQVTPGRSRPAPGMIVTTPAACQHLEVPKRDNSLDDDPGWPSIKTLFLLFIPIVGGAAARRAGRINGTDGLLMLRQTWQSFFGALVVVGLIVPLLTMNADGETADPWLALVALTTAGLVGAHLLVGGQSLDGSDSTRLFRSYRKRFFVRSGLVAAMGLVALLAALAAKQWWLYWIVAPIALAVSTLHAPTSRNLRTDQERLSQRGCMLPLNRSLRSFGQS